MSGLRSAHFSQVIPYGQETGHGVSVDGGSPYLIDVAKDLQHPLPYHCRYNWRPSCLCVLVQENRKKVGEKVHKLLSHSSY